MFHQPIKVVHISTSYKGGAGTAAFRIHKALLKTGIHSHFICLDENPVDVHMSKLFLEDSKAKRLNTLSKFSNKLKWRLKHHLNIELISNEEAIKRKFKLLFPKLNCEAAKLPFSNYNILEDKLVQNADIIHLHWVANLLDYPTFFKNVNKPVVWTFHDMNPFQGMFHYKEDEVKNRDLASSLDKKIKSLKKKAIRSISSKLSIVAPSKWLLTEAINSKIFRFFNKYCIPYPIDVEIFNTKSVYNLRKSLNISNQNTIFLFVAERSANHRKGLDLLINALKSLDNKSITLMIIGNSENLNTTGLNVILLGTISDNKILSDYYSLADAFILPSREDNLPNVMLEAMSCGTPVISFNVGGMSDIIEDKFNGLKAKKIESAELAKTLKEFLNTKGNYSKEAIRNFAVNSFSENLIAEKYKIVYKKLVLENA